MIAEDVKAKIQYAADEAAKGGATGVFWVRDVVADTDAEVIEYAEDCLRGAYADMERLRD